MSVFKRCLPFIVGGVLLGQAVGVLAGEAPQGRQTLKWWKSEAFQKDLGLTGEQEGRIDAIFMQTLPELRQSKDELDRLESQVSRLIEADTDQATLTRWIEKTESARGRLNLTRTLMLIRMRQVLTPDQRIRFKALQERYDRARHPLDSRRPPEAPVITK